MTFARGIDGSEPVRARPASARTGAHEDAEASRSFRVAIGTLACPLCDAPVALGGRALSLAEDLDCPFCGHGAAVRDFLSLAAPARPARVELRAVSRAARARR